MTTKDMTKEDLAVLLDGEGWALLDEETRRNLKEEDHD